MSIIGRSGIFYRISDSGSWHGAFGHGNPRRVSIGASILKSGFGARNYWYTYEAEPKD